MTTICAQLQQLDPSRIRGLIIRAGNLRTEELKKIFTALPYLEELYLDSNNIENIPEEITNLSNLRILSLKNNPLDCLPNYIIELPNLETLMLPNHYSFKLSPEIINHLPHLYQVNLNSPSNNDLHLLQDIVQIRDQYFQKSQKITNLIKTLGSLLIELPKVPEVNNYNMMIIHKLKQAFYDLKFVHTRLRNETVIKPDNRSSNK
ncbi:leucine-rich repeat domain-containing protein [Candidatus Dependentiae bacterium]|nr:MAG: leucine-rich repeat domain-containing protein [Candidatus Dependentiae bacterium]